MEKCLGCYNYNILRSGSMIDYTDFIFKIYLNTFINISSVGSSGVFQKGGARFSLATSAHTKRANYVFQFFPMVKKKFCQRGHGPMAP